MWGMSRRSGAVALPLTLILTAGLASADDPVPLALGILVQREIKPGETHHYRIPLREGEYFQAQVEQRGADLVATVRGPDGRVVLVSDHTFEYGPEPIAFVASAAGPHDVALEHPTAPGFPSTGPAGHYELRVEALRAPSDPDLLRERAIRAQMEAYGAGGPMPEPRQTVERLREARAVWDRLGDRRMRMWIDFLLAMRLGGVLGEVQEAVAFLQQSLATAREIDDEFAQAVALVGLSEFQRRQGDPEEARRGLDQALKLHRAAGQRYREAVVLLKLGGLFHEGGDMQAALDKHYEALPIFQESQDAEGISATRYGIGRAYLELGENELALGHYRLALEAAATSIDAGWRPHLLGQIGDVLYRQGDLEGARGRFEDARDRFKALGSRVGVASMSARIGQLERGAGRLEAARAILEEAVAVFHDAGDAVKEADTRCQLGETHRQRGDLESARTAFESALKLIPTSHVRRLCADEGLARLSYDRGDLAGARNHAEQALAIGESLRASVVSHESRTVALASTQPLYELLIDVRMRQHDAEPFGGHDVAGFEVGERARARSLLELIREHRLDIRSGVDAALLAEERSLRLRLNARWEAQEKALAGNQREQMEGLDREIAGLTEQLRDLEARIRRASPRYASLTQPQPLAFDEIRDKVLDSDTVLLEYSLGERASYLWVVSKEGLATHRLAARDEIERAARRVHALASSAPGDTGSGVTPPATAWLEATEELSRLVLPADLSRTTAMRLLVVAPGALQFVPFAVLPMPGGNPEGRPGQRRLPLLERFEVLNAPSASVMATLRNEGNRRGPSTKSVAIFADPVFDASDPRVRKAMRVATSGPGAPGTASASSLPESPPTPLERALKGVRAAGRGGLARLPFSRWEAQAIVALAPRGTSLSAIGFDANRTTATRADLEDFRIVHFATHAVVNTRQPELSGVVLSLLNRKGQPEDGFLRLHEICDLRLGAELVVLSACQTGLGKDVRGEGLVGLTRAFMYAGAPRVVASLWQVDDLATAELMKRFYRGVFEAKLTPAAALRAAQRDLAASMRWNAPFFWGGFVLHGDWR